MAADPALLANLVRLASAPEHDAFRRWLGRERETWRDFLETTRDPMMANIAQGRAQMLKEIQDSLVNALARSRG